MFRRDGEERVDDRVGGGGGVDGEGEPCNVTTLFRCCCCCRCKGIKKTVLIHYIHNGNNILFFILKQHSPCGLSFSMHSTKLRLSSKYEEKHSPSFLGKDVNTPHVLYVEVSYPIKKVK